MGVMVSPITGRRRQRRVPRSTPRTAPARLAPAPSTSPPWWPRLAASTAEGRRGRRRHPRSTTSATRRPSWRATPPPGSRDRGHEVRMPLRDAGDRRPLRASACAEDELRPRARPRAQPRRRRHDAAHGRPRVAPTACPSSGSTSASSATSPRSSRAGLRMALKRFLAGVVRGRGAHAAADRGRDRPAARRRSLDGDAARAVATTPPYLALNEAVLEKTPMGHTVRLRCQHRRRGVHHLRCRRPDRRHPHGVDGLRLLGPGTDRRAHAPCLLLTPVSPHMLFDRSLVLAPDARLRLEVVRRPPGHALGRRPQPRHAAARATR